MGQVDRQCVDALGVLLDEKQFRRIRLTAEITARYHASMSANGFSLSHTYGTAVVQAGKPAFEGDAGGWQFSRYLCGQSGLADQYPLGSKRGLTDALLLGTAAGSQRPNLTGPLNLQFAPNPGRHARKQCDQLRTWAQPLWGTSGTLGRNAPASTG